MKNDTSWIERQILPKRKLADGGAASLWESVRTTIERCCQEFNIHSSGSADVKSAGQRELQVNVTPERQIQDKLPTRTAVIGFDEAAMVFKVRTIIAEESAVDRTFKLAADEDHAFITWQEREISADKFSRLALEGILFPAGQ